MTAMKTYQLNKPVLLTNTMAEQLGVHNRIYQVGELLDMHDELAKPLLKKGTIKLYVVPVPVVIEPPKKVTKKPVVKTKDIKSKESK